jgi:DNA polymerase
VTPSPENRAVESLLAFWRDAGVEDCFEDAPQDRLTEGARRLRASAPPPASPLRAEAPSSLAADLAEAVMAAREAALAASDLDSLKAAVEAFQGSVLRTTGARQTVFARGRPDAEVVIIGEAPGTEEDSRGEPFVGRAGRLLDRALAAAGLTERVFITNTVFWRPPGDRNPSAQEQGVCEPFLDRTISLIRPKVLLLLGAASSKSVLKQEGGILSIRGRWFERVSDDGTLKTPALPTLHPAFLLRQPQAKRLFWQDLLALGTRLEAPEPPE